MTKFMLPEHADVARADRRGRRRCRRDLPGSIVPTSVGEAEQVGGVDGGGDDRRHRRHAVLDHQQELVGVAAVHRDAGVGAEGDADAGGDGAAQRLAGDADPPLDLLAHLAG